MLLTVCEQRQEKCGKICRIHAIYLREGERILSESWSGFAKDEIDDPAAADVRVAVSAVVEDGAFTATGVFEGVGEDGKTAEVLFCVNGGREPADGAVVGRQQVRIEAGRTEGIAEDIAEELALDLAFPASQQLHV